MQEKEKYNFVVELNIKDKDMKPQYLHGQNTEERISWIEVVPVTDVEDADEAKLMALMAAYKIWDVNKYIITTKSVMQK